MTILGWILLFCSAHQAPNGAPWLAFTLLFSCACVTKRPTSLLFCCQCQCLGRGRLPSWLNSIALLSWLPGSSPQAFLTTISSFTSPWTTLCAMIPILQLLGVVLFRGPASLSGLGMTAARIVCVILTPVRLPQVICFTLSFKCFSSVPNNCPTVGIRPLLQFPQLARAGQVLVTLLFSPLLPSSYWVLHVTIYSFPVVWYSCSL